MKHNFKDMTGQKFNRLTFISLVESATRANNKKSSVWLLKCDCGNSKISKTTKVIRGDVKSCGCLRKETASSIKKITKGLANFNSLYLRYKWSAKNRDLVFNIAKDHFKAIVTSNCYFCGIEPRQSYNAKATNGEFIYNGVDRLDNKQGYVIENVVSCCKICNRAKNNETLENFMEWIDRIKNYDNGKNH